MQERDLLLREKASLQVGVPHTSGAMPAGYRLKWAGPHVRGRGTTLPRGAR
jgi:hypothetical protein